MLPREQHTELRCYLYSDALAARSPCGRLPSGDSLLIRCRITPCPRRGQVGQWSRRGHATVGAEINYVGVIMTTIDEIAPDVFRVPALTDPARDFSPSCFLIRDEQPTLVETGFRPLFAETWDALARVIDPGDLRFVVVPHVEADESGALNAFLDRAPHAVPVCSPVGVVTNLRDFAVRDPLPVDESSQLDLGTHRLRFLITPYVHTWEASDAAVGRDDRHGVLLGRVHRARRGTSFH